MPVIKTLPDGRKFEVPDGASTEEIERIANRLMAQAAGSGPTREREAANRRGGIPERSLIGDRTWGDTAIDALPALVGTAAGFYGGTKLTPSGVALSAAGTAAGEAARQGIRYAQGRTQEYPATAQDAALRIAEAGAIGAGSEIGGRKVISGLKWIAPKLMRSALGAQTEVRKAFPGINLDQAAVDARLIPGSARSLARIERMGEEGAQNVRARLRTIDAASGNAPVAGYDDAVERLRGTVSHSPVRDARMMARTARPERLEAIQQIMRDLRPMKGRPVGAEETYLGAREHLKFANEALRAKAGATGSAQSEAAQEVGLSLSQTLKKAHPEMGNALRKQQELIALERAMFNAQPRTPLLRNVLAASAGGATGAGVMAGGGDPLTAIAAGVLPMIATHAVSAPGALARYGIAADLASRTLRHPLSRIPEALLRKQLLQALLGENTPDVPND